MTQPSEPAVRPRTARPRRRRGGRRLLFATVLLGLIGTGQEILFRWTFPIPEVVGFNRIRYQLLADQDPRFRPILRRGLVYDRLLVESVPDGYSEIHRLNRHGFRGPDFAIEPNPARPRVLVIGDSLTEGQGAPESGTISAYLDRLLRERGEPAEVLNLGVIAATLHHATLLARDAIGLLRPSTVVLVLYANDLPAPPYLPDLDQAPPRYPRSDVPWFLPRALALVGRVSRDEPIYSRWPRPPVRYFAPSPDPTNPWSKSQGPPPNVDPDLYRSMKAGELNPWLVQQAEAIPGMLAHDFTRGGTPYLHLRRVADLCRAAGARLIVAYVPFCGVIHPRYGAAQTKLGMDPTTAEGLASDPRYRSQSAHLAAIRPTLDLPLADATEALTRAEASGKPQYWEFDTHPRPDGYATIARRIVEVWPTDQPK
ncbi:MAG: GDSL-type esterase/lipase family protein [Isosphaeraceae bacterium]